MNDPSRNAGHFPAARSRRDFLVNAGGGCGALALTWMLARDGCAATPAPAGPAAKGNPLAAKPGHFEAKAKSVIFLFMFGGASHVDLFDPKPELTKWNGKPLPPSF